MERRLANVDSQRVTVKPDATVGRDGLKLRSTNADAEKDGRKSRSPPASVRGNEKARKCNQWVLLSH